MFLLFFILPPYHPYITIHFMEMIFSTCNISTTKTTKILVYLLYIYSCRSTPDDWCVQTNYLDIVLMLAKGIWGTGLQTHHYILPLEHAIPYRSIRTFVSPKEQLLAHSIFRSFVIIFPSSFSLNNFSALMRLSNVSFFPEHLDGTQAVHLHEAIIVFSLYN